MIRPGDRRAHIGSPPRGRSDMREDRTRHLPRIPKKSSGSTLREERNEGGLRRIASPVRATYLRAPKRSRSPRERHFDRDRGRDRHPREREIPDIPDVAPRPGLVFGQDNCRDFIKKLLNDVNYELARRNPRMIIKSFKEEHSALTKIEKEKFPSCRTPTASYCAIHIEGYPAAVFNAGGYGHKPHIAKMGAAKNLVDKFMEIGFVTPSLFDALMREPTLSKNRSLPHYQPAINFLVRFHEIMESESWPPEIITARALEVAAMQRINTTLEQVRSEIFPGVRKDARGIAESHQDKSIIRSQSDIPVGIDVGDIERRIKEQREELLRRERLAIADTSTKSAKDLNALIEPIDDLRPSWNVPAPHPYMAPNPFGFNAGPSSGYPQFGQPAMDPMLIQREEEARRRAEEEERLRLKEMELKLKLELELQMKKKQMEEDIRRQIHEEERARVAEMMRLQGHNQSSIPAPIHPYSMTARPIVNEEEEISQLVKETETKLMDLQRCANQETLNAIFESRVFQLFGGMAQSTNAMDNKQKRDLLIELNQLLTDAQASIKSADHSKAADSYNRSRRSRSRSRSRERYDQDLRHQRSRSRSPGSLRRHNDVIVQVGSMRLRNLTPAEQRVLDRDAVVIAQDMKTGRWQSGKVVKVSDNRAILSVGTSTWKKALDELFVEAPPSMESSFGSYQNYPPMPYPPRF